MNYNTYKSFDITKKRPQVLLVGNGILRTKEFDVNWKDVIGKISGDGSVVEKNWGSTPYSVLASITTACDDKTRREKYSEYFNGVNDGYRYKQNDRIKKLMDIEFDAVLTTNYTYEIENELKPGFWKLNKKDKYVCTTVEKYSKIRKEKTVKKKVAHKILTDKTFLLRTFNRLENENGYNQNIWHIHGETRRKSSLVLTHDEYGRLMSKLQAYNQEKGKGYEKNLNKFKMDSWFDYFLLGDVYILGLGFDFSEFDLWWMISRKQRCNSKYGKIYFFNPQNVNKNLSDVEKALKKFGVEIENCNITVPHRDCILANEYYDKFYNIAIDNIAGKVKENKEEKK